MLFTIPPDYAQTGRHGVYWAVHPSLMRRVNTHLYTWATIQGRYILNMERFGVIRCNLIQFLNFCLM